MGKFVGGLITGSVLTLAGLGIAAAISDGTFDNLFDSFDSVSDESNKKNDSEQNDDSEKRDEDESSETENIRKPIIGLRKGLLSIVRTAVDEVGKTGEVISNELEKEVHLTDEQRDKLVEKYGSVKEGLSILLGNNSEEDKEEVES